MGDFAQSQQGETKMMTTLLFLCWTLIMSLVVYVSIKGPEKLAIHIIGEY
ncbi:MAG: hypothetical protein WCV68_01240 [Candidatus Paceibacterota bacterium]